MRLTAYFDVKGDLLSQLRMPFSVLLILPDAYPATNFCEETLHLLFA